MVITNTLGNIKSINEEEAKLSKMLCEIEKMQKSVEEKDMGIFR